MTKRYHVLNILFTVCSVLANIVPLAFFIVSAYLQAEVVHEKLAMTAAVVCSIILTAVWFITKIQLRSRIWILLIGLFICLDYALAAIITIAICQIVDEIILCPLKKRYHNLYVINREIDKR